jgi:ketosteroid isomerase-like protein
LTQTRTSTIAHPEATRQNFRCVRLGKATTMKQILSLMIMLCAASAFGQSVDAVTNAPREVTDGKVLLQMERDWNEALKTRNVAWLEQNLADDMTDVMSRDGSVSTKAANIESLKNDKATYDSLEITNLKVRVDGNAGIVTGVNHIKAHDEVGEPVEMNFAFTDTYIKRDGRWQVWASQHTRIKP